MTQGQLSLFALGGSKPTVDWTKADQELLQRKESLAAGGPPGWRPNRLILMNYWLFTYEEFYFVQGRLVLRGSNGSGKSTALAAAITLALDGEKRRERMDTFGGQGRSVAYYLVGHQTATPESDFYFHERTAYVVLEFEHATQRRFASVGVGLYTSRGRPNLDVDFWGFTISDGRRPGIDLPLFDETADGRIPLTGRQLKERIGLGAQVTGRQGEYQRMVNGLLFGMPDEEYDDLLKVLVQLRSPKLNKDIKPSDVCESLARSLPPLQEDLLAQVTRIIEDIDTQEATLEGTKKHLQAVAELDDKLDRYLNQLAQQSALDYREDRARQEADEIRLRTATDQAQALASQLHEKQTAMADLIVRREEKKGRLSALERSPAFAEARDLETADHDRDDAEKRLQAADAAVVASQTALDQLSGELSRIGCRWEVELALLEQKGVALAETAEEAAWPTAMEAVAGLRSTLAGLRLDGQDRDASDLLAPVLVLGPNRLEHLQFILDSVLGVEKAQAEHEVSLAASRRVEAERDHASDQVTEAEDGLYEARDQAIGQLYEWRNGTRELVPAPDELAGLVDTVREYPKNGADLQRLADMLGARLMRRPQEELERQSRRLQTQKAGLLAQQERLEQELRSWQNRSDAEPDRTETQAEARRLLAVGSIPAVPLFAACDFRPDVDPAEAARIEAAMADAGLLDALLVPADRAEEVEQLLKAAGLGDRWLAPAPISGQPTLADLLLPCKSPLGQTDVLAALRSVAVDRGVGPNAVVTPGGRWQIGPLQGVAVPVGGVRYIGLENRRRRREEEMARLLQELQEAGAQIRSIDQDLDHVSKRQEQLADEREALRTLAAWSILHEKGAKLFEAERWLERCQKNVTAELERQKKSYGALQEAKGRLQSEQSSVPESRGRSSDGIRTLTKATDSLIMAGRYLAERAGGLQALREQWYVTEGYRETEQKRLANALTQRKSDRAQFEKLKALAETLLERVVGLGIEELRQEANQLRNDVAGLDEEEKRLIDVAATLKANAANADREVVLARRDSDRSSAAEANARIALVDRLRAYPTLQPYLDRATRDRGQVLACADDLLKLRRTGPEGLRKAIEESKTEATKHLSDTYSRYQSDLVEYHLEWEGDLVTFRDRGVRLLPCQLRERLEGERQYQLAIVRERETELYEEFILRQVSSHIRELVGRVHDWLDRVNDLLKQRKLTNDEVLSIGWRPRPADRVTGVDMARVVELLRQDPDKLPQEQVDELIAHFRTQVNEVRGQEKRGDQEQSFADALAEVLDYRLWFEFTLHSKIPGQERQHMTDIRFTARSGAEKSLAMFIPLLAAAHARFETAAPDAPRLVGLDEAFAGVDEQNTKEMFRFLVELNFSWIMTSEKLWGVAETLPGCATYELVRHGNVVTPIFYLWDGTRRHGSLESALGEVAATREE